MSNTVAVPTVNGVANGEFFSYHISAVDLFVEFLKTSQVCSFPRLPTYDRESCSSNCDFRVEQQGQFIDKSNRRLTQNNNENYMSHFRLAWIFKLIKDVFACVLLSTKSL